MSSQYFTTTQAAKIFNISRMEMLRRIKNNEIKAQKVGSRYIIHESQIKHIFKKANQKTLEKINKAVKKVVKEYGETLVLLGKE